MKTQAAIAVLFVSIAALAVDFDYKATAAKSETFVAAGAFDDAEKLLTSSRPLCASLSSAKECVGRLDFALGYALASRGDAASLARAEKAYRDALTIFDKSADLHANLADVLRREAKLDDAAAAFDQAAKLEKDKVRSRGYMLESAESRRAAGKYDEALTNFRDAIDKGSSDAADRMVVVMAEWIGGATTPEDRQWRTRQTLEEAHKLRLGGSLGPAVEAYETVMGRHADLPDLAVQALAGWTETRASARTLTPSALKRIPAGWDSPFARGLAETMATGKWSFADESLKTTLPHYAALAAASAAAGTLAARGETEKALVLATEVMDRAPQPAQQDRIPELKSRPVIYLDAALQIARLSTATGNTNRFSTLEQRLFGAKGSAYQTNNLAAVQRLHTVLGTIYAERGTWSSAGPFTNATFQLNAALRTAKQRETAEGILQPLPHLHVTLADGFRRQNRASAALEEDLAAARDYLDLDAIAPANEALTRVAAMSAVATPEVKIGLATLKEIAGYRDTIPTLVWSQSVKPPAWSAQTAAPGLDSAFLARQKFKTLTDLAGKAGEVGDANAAQYFSYNAHKAIEGQKLVGAEDRWRLTQIEQTLDPAPKPKTKVQKYQLDDSTLFREPDVKPLKVDRTDEFTSKYSNAGTWTSFLNGKAKTTPAVTPTVKPSTVDQPSVIKVPAINTVPAKTPIDNTTMTKVPVKTDATVTKTEITDTAAPEATVDPKTVSIKKKKTMEKKDETPP